MKRRCLIPASKFRTGAGDHRYRVTLDSGNFFYLAAAWDPPLADWPLSYCILNIPAGADVIPYQTRHSVIVERRNFIHWLDGTLPNEVLFEEPPRHTFLVKERSAQAALPCDQHCRRTGNANGASGTPFRPAVSRPRL